MVDDRPLQYLDCLSMLATTIEAISEFETIPIEAAVGRYLADSIKAPLSRPPFHQAAMDGYAISSDAISRLPASFNIRSTLFSGRVNDDDLRSLAKDEAVRIFTGAPLPANADIVIAQEQALLEGGRLQLNTPLLKGQHCRWQGEEFARGQPIIAAKQRLGAAEVGLLASVGIGQCRVYRRCKIALFSTGAELMSPGLGPAQYLAEPYDNADKPPSTSRFKIFDANRYLLHALLTDASIEVLPFAPLADELPSLTHALLAASETADLVITSGGASVGDADLIYPFLAKQGQVSCRKVNIKPGKPFIVGSLNQTPFLGLAGNPAAAMIAYLMLGQAIVIQRAGGQYQRPQPQWVAADFTLQKSSRRREFLRATVDRRVSPATIQLSPHQGSASLLAMTQSDGLVEIEESIEQIQLGQHLPFYPFETLMKY